MSDLVVGLDIPSGVDLSPFPFPVLPANRINPSDNVHVYLEIYHLVYGRDNKAHYTVTFHYDVTKKRGLLSRLIGRGKKKETISITHNFTLAERTAKEKIAFDISELEPGEYEFLVEVFDTVSMQKKVRKGKFGISDQ